MANACTSQQKHKLHFVLPKNSVPRLHKVQYRNWHISERLRALHMCQQKPRTAYSGLENKQTAKDVKKYLHFLIFICWKFRCTKYTQIAQVNGSVIRVLVSNTIQFLCTYTASEGKDVAGFSSSLLHINSQALLFRLKNLQQDFPEQSHN